MFPVDIDGADPQAQRPIPMDYERLLRVGDVARFRGRLAAADQEFIRVETPRDLAGFPRIRYPARLRHPAGFTLNGAVVRTFVKCALVLAARRTWGPKFWADSEFYDRVERELALDILCSHFRHGDPKGTFCCAQCTLASYPVLQADAIRWFDGRSLAKDVRALILKRAWRFSASTNPRLVDWALASSTANSRSAVQ